MWSRVVRFAFAVLVTTGTVGAEPPWRARRRDEVGLAIAWLPSRSYSLRERGTRILIARCLGDGVHKDTHLMRRIAAIGDATKDLEVQQRCDRIIRKSNICRRCDGEGHLRRDPDKPHYPWTPENSECDRCLGSGTTWRLSRDPYRR